MQALAERLDAITGGGELTGIQPLQFSALKTVRVDPMSLVGRTIESVGRRGKYLVVRLPPDRILVHLSQGGRVDVEDPLKDTRPGKQGVVRFRLRDRPSLLVKEYGTERKAGWWVLAEEDEGPLADLGPEPGSEEFRRGLLHGDDRRRVHTLLRDQRAVSRMGRGYTDDALHRGRISPFTPLA